MSVDPALTALTYRFERWRAACSGIVESGQTTFLLLIAVSWFDLGPTAKAMLVGGQSLGLICGPLVVNLTQRLGWTVTRAASRMTLLGAAGMGAAALFAHPVVFVTGAMLATFSAAAIVPLLTQVFKENYPAASRGRLYSRAFMVRIGVAVAVSQAGGWLLARDLSHYRWLLALFSAAMVAASHCLGRVPSRPLAPSESSHPLRALRHVREDRVFRQVLISWMLMGFGNLISLPLRIEYLANPVHGLAMTPDQVAFLAGVVPNLARLVVTPFCGWAFDRMNFFTLRAWLNMSFAVSILAFFTTNSQWGLLAGAVVFGASVAGGDVAWALWVTKLAPSGRVADYMSIHASLTGLRGIVAPLIAFHAISHYSLAAVGWACVGLIVLGNLALLPEILSARQLEPAAGPLEDLPE